MRMGKREMWKWKRWDETWGEKGKTLVVWFCVVEMWCDRKDYRVHLTFSRGYINFVTDEKISIEIHNTTE